MTKKEKQMRALDLIEGGLINLNNAIASGDPRGELLLRVSDLCGDIKALRALSSAQHEAK